MIRKIKTAYKTIVFLFGFMLLKCSGQQVLSSTMITDLDGRKKDIVSVIDSGKTTIIIFWNVWSHISQNEIDIFAERKDEIESRYKAEVILISMDDTRNYQKVKPLIAGRTWPFQGYIDLNGDLKRELNVLYPPTTIVISPGLRVFYTKLGYLPGDEEIIINKLSEIK